jgi:hypothetical protein
LHFDRSINHSEDSMTLNDAVPEHLRPTEWANLQLELAAAGWTLDQASKRLAAAAAVARSPGYIVKVMRSMLDENPSIDRTPPPNPAGTTIRTTNIPGLGRTITAHPFTGTNTYCTTCQLPQPNRIHIP